MGDFTSWGHIRPIQDADSFFLQEIVKAKKKPKKPLGQGQIQDSDFTTRGQGSKMIVPSFLQALPGLKKPTHPSCGSIPDGWDAFLHT